MTDKQNKGRPQFERQVADQSAQQVRPESCPSDSGLLSEEGEERRRFLKRALIAGGGLAAANLLLEYEGKAFEASQPASSPLISTRIEDQHLTRVTLRINGNAHSLEIEPRVTLLDALRERVGLTGTKKGCDRGQCGACTVLADGKRVNSCLALALAYEGKEITTIEGLARGEVLHPVQAAFIAHDGFQCGFCTPGQIVSAVGLLSEGCPPGMTIRDCMSGNICRCGAYPGIVAAIEQVRGVRS